MDNLEYTVTVPVIAAHIKLPLIRQGLDAYTAAKANYQVAVEQLQALGISVAQAEGQTSTRKPRTPKTVRDLGPARMPGFKKDGTPRLKPGRKPKSEAAASPLANQPLGGYAIKKRDQSAESAG